jgi:hypothetical protein
MDAKSMLNYSVSGTSMSPDKTHASYTVSTSPNTVWDYWQGWFYPEVIRQSYPVYLQDRSKDSGKQAFEIIKALQDKKLMKLDKVSDFIEAMDVLIKQL